MNRSTRVLSILLLIAAAPACRKPSIHGGATPPAPNVAPTAAVTAPAGVQTGILPVSYMLSDPESNKAKIVVEWSTDAGATYFPATRSLLGTEGVTNLTTFPAGTPHVFLWDSAVDGVGKPGQATVRFRVTPSDSDPGTAGTADFDVNNQVTAFRINTMVLRDPHIFFSIIFVAPCQDVTDSGGTIPGAPPGGVNGQVQTQLTTDGDGDGNIDASPLLLFRMFDQAGAGGKMELASGRFAVATPTTGDLLPGSERVPATYLNVAAGTLLSPGAGTTKPYAPSVAEPAGPGFVTDPVSYTVPLGTLNIPLEGFRVAGTYNINPATSIVSGLAMGFISEADAQHVQVPLGTAGSVTLASLLPGGVGNCSLNDDSDVGPDGTTSGWWFYFNFTAQLVTYTGP